MITTGIYILVVEIWIKLPPYESEKLKINMFSAEAPTSLDPEEAA